MYVDCWFRLPQTVVKGAPLLPPLQRRTRRRRSEDPPQLRFVAKVALWPSPVTAQKSPNTAPAGGVKAAKHESGSNEMLRRSRGSTDTEEAEGEHGTTRPPRLPGVGAIRVPL